MDMQLTFVINGGSAQEMSLILKTALHWSELPFDQFLVKQNTSEQYKSFNPLRLYMMVLYTKFRYSRNCKCKEKSISCILSINFYLQITTHKTGGQYFVSKEQLYTLLNFFFVHTQKKNGTLLVTSNQINEDTCYRAKLTISLQQGSAAWSWYWRWGQLSQNVLQVKQLELILEVNVSLILVNNI